jgi:hypothetical protein
VSQGVFFQCDALQFFYRDLATLRRNFYGPLFNSVVPPPPQKKVLGIKIFGGWGICPPPAEVIDRTEYSITLLPADIGGIWGLGSWVDSCPHLIFST